MPSRTSDMEKLQKDCADLKSDLINEELTKKGYCNKLLRVLKSYLTENVLDSIARIQSDLALKKLNDDEYFTKVSSVIEPELDNLFKRNTKRKKVKDVDKESVENKDCNNIADVESFKEIAEENKMDVEDNDVNDEDYGSKPKKRKTQRKQSEGKKSSSNKKDSMINKCQFCRQFLHDTDLKLYAGPPNNAEEEYVALVNPKLSLFDDDVGGETFDSRPQNKITCFSVYDKNGHLCPFDSGLIEKNIMLLFSGYLKPIYEEDPSHDGGVPAKELGPINAWSISGYDGGDVAMVSFTTDYGEYFLMEPSEEYKPFMTTLMEKVYLGKLVIETCLNDENTTFEDLLNELQTALYPRSIGFLTEDHLLRHAEFICDQVMSFDNASEDPEETQLIVTPCVRTLIQLAGVTFKQRKTIRASDRSKQGVSKQNTFSKATTTDLVQDVFETFFRGQLNENKKVEGPRKRRCGICEQCQQPECGTCTSCLDMTKFGGTGKAKQACLRRRCPNMAVQEAEDSDLENEKEDEGGKVVKELSKPDKKVQIKSDKKKTTAWVGDIVKEKGQKIYYKSAIVAGQEIHVGDIVMIESVDVTSPRPVAKICYMFEGTNFKEKKCHIMWFARGTETVLEELCDPQELFLTHYCEDILLSAIACHCVVTYYPTPDNWSMLGGTNEETPPVDRSDDKSFYYRQFYDMNHARFTDIPIEPMCEEGEEYKHCVSCIVDEKEQDGETPKLVGLVDQDQKHDYYSSIEYLGESFSLKTCIYLSPESLNFKRRNGNENIGKTKKIIEDEDLYPEAYRKLSDNIKGSNLNTPCPFDIGYITSILKKKGNQKSTKIINNISITVKKLYRPEHTHRSIDYTYQADLNKLYWSEEEQTVGLAQVEGKCYVVCQYSISEPISEWTAKGPDRFYFEEAYDSKSEKFVEPPPDAILLGIVSKGKGKKLKCIEAIESQMKEWPTISRPLRCLDVFAGAGGLSKGLHDSGMADTKWAIEIDVAAANAFRLNNPNTTVFTDDCNVLLQKVMQGDAFSDKKQKLPRKGDVELLVGGPPCQGFSGMNRFNSRQYSAFKNSLIVSYLSYCDYYRPRYFILENVRNFVAFKGSMVLRLTLKCLQQMGYQCTFGILQAGHFGVPQTRRRAIIIAAAPGEILPTYPEPLTVFNLRSSTLSVTVGKKTFTSTCKRTRSAPYRTITVRDAMSDLPEIRNGCKTEVMSYKEDALSHFQRQMRKNNLEMSALKDHICKEMAALVEARMAHIPTVEGSDWRDLPNIVVKLKDGTYSKKLQYTHNDKKNGKSSTDALRGVCACATGQQCDPMDRQFGTLIPWCLPHTGNRHNNWAGLYGRLEWSGFFSTTITNPEPMGKQGRVLHPDQNRVVSVRECARSQGFPDCYKFFGSVLEKHRQVGNAVPPPMGEALGREIKKSVYLKEMLERVNGPKSAESDQPDLSKDMIVDEVVPSTSSVDEVVVLSTLSSSPSIVPKDKIHEITSSSTDSPLGKPLSSKDNNEKSDTTVSAKNSVSTNMKQELTSSASNSEDLFNSDEAGCSSSQNENSLEKDISHTKDRSNSDKAGCSSSQNDNSFEKESIHSNHFTSSDESPCSSSTHL